MSPRFAHRPMATFLLFATAAVLIASVAFAQSSVRFNDGLLMDDDLLTMLEIDSSHLLNDQEYTFSQGSALRPERRQSGSLDLRPVNMPTTPVPYSPTWMPTTTASSWTRDEINAAHMNMLRSMMYKNPHAPNVPAVADAMIARMDADHDGKISAPEYASAMKARFDEIDEP